MTHSSFQQQQFLDVLDRDEAERRFHAALDLSPLEAEEVALADAWTRVLAEDVIAPIDVPGFDRSNVDGFAVTAEDTFGATEERPRTLELKGMILIGTMPTCRVTSGTAIAIVTGGVVPRGADAVVMIEHTDLEGQSIRIRRPIVPGSNISFAGTDIGRGETVLRRGQPLTSRETGVLAALGVASVRVVRQPRVAIISTGNELVPPGAPLPAGAIYDSNATVLADAVRESGGLPVSFGIVPDDEAALGNVVRRALSCDVLLLSGGTSKGAGDLSYRVFAGLGAPGIVAHGVALKPGKPLCLAVVPRPPSFASPESSSPTGSPATRRGRPIPVAVLPGFPTSAVFTFQEFLAPAHPPARWTFGRCFGVLDGASAPASQFGARKNGVPVGRARSEFGINVVSEPESGRAFLRRVSDGRRLWLGNDVQPGRWVHRHSPRAGVSRIRRKSRSAALGTRPEAGGPGGDRQPLHRTGLTPDEAA